MSKFKRWLYERFLPAWCRDGLVEANRRLQAKVDAQAAEIDRLNAYIDGMQDAMIRQSRIIINGKEAAQ